MTATEPDIIITSILNVEKYTDKLSTLIFDLDDTLYSEKDYVKSGYREIANLYPMFPGMEDELWESFLHKGKAIDDVLLNYGLLTEENRAKCLHAYHFQTPNICLYDGVDDMLNRLKRNKFRLGLITDGRPEGQRAKIKALNIENVFDKIIITDELGGISFRKPNETAFIQMCEMLNIRFDEAAYIGDNIKKDFEAPKELGMKTIMFKNPNGIYYEP